MQCKSTCILQMRGNPIPNHFRPINGDEVLLTREWSGPPAPYLGVLRATGSLPGSAQGHRLLQRFQNCPQFIIEGWISSDGRSFVPENFPNGAQHNFMKRRVAISIICSSCVVYYLLNGRVARTRRHLLILGLRDDRFWRR